MHELQVLGNTCEFWVEPGKIGKRINYPLGGLDIDCVAVVYMLGAQMMIANTN